MPKDELINIIKDAMMEYKQVKEAAMEIRKRTSRSKVIIDEDDLMLLSLSMLNPNLDSLKKKMNISHTCLLIHIQRLKEYNLIKVHRYKNNYKRKYIKITVDGFKLGKLLNFGEVIRKNSNNLPKISKGNLETTS